MRGPSDDEKSLVRRVVDPARPSLTPGVAMAPDTAWPAANLPGGPVPLPAEAGDGWRAGICPTSPVELRLPSATWWSGALRRRWP